MKRLIVDGQIFQTPAWHRGMGKYSVELLRALQATTQGWSKIDLLLSDGIETDGTRLDEIKQQLPGLNIVSLPMMAAEINNINPTEVNRRVVEEYIDKNTNKNDKVDYLVLSILQSGTAPAFPELSNVHTVLLFYDLIPLMFFKTYLKNKTSRLEYISRFDEFFRADTYLAISKTVANDLAWHTGISKDRIATIDGGPIGRGRTFKKTLVGRPFILMPTGDDLRKNNRRAIEAFAKFNNSVDGKYQLVVTSYFTEAEKERLQSLSSQVLFTGNIEGSQLNYLYRESTALLFPTEYEGLGLPILEAMEFKKPILCSDISVFREISTVAFEYFNPFDVSSIVTSLRNLDDGKVVPDSSIYIDILKKYTWKNTSKRAKQAMKKTTSAPVSKKKIVSFTPLPSRSIVGRSVQLLHAELSRYADITYRYESEPVKYEQRINYTAYMNPENYVLSASSEIILGQDETPLYHIENLATSARAVFTALANPGVVILYDKSLKIVWRALLEMQLIHQKRYDIEQELSCLYSSEDSFLLSLLSSQKVVIVHNRVLQGQLQSLKKKAQLDVKVAYHDMPAAETVYPEVLPINKSHKRLTINIASPSEPKAQESPKNDITMKINERGLYRSGVGTPVTDYELITAIVSAERVQCATNAPLCGILEAQANALAADKNVATHIPSYRSFAKKIYQLIDEVNHE